MSTARFMSGEGARVPVQWGQRWKRLNMRGRGVYGTLNRQTDMPEDITFQQLYLWLVTMKTTNEMDLEYKILYLKSFSLNIFKIDAISQ